MTEVWVVGYLGSGTGHVLDHVIFTSHMSWGGVLEAQNAKGFGISVPDYRLQYKTHETPKSLRMMACVLMLLGSFLITFLAAQYFIWTYCTLSCLSLLVAYLYILSMYVSNVLFILSLPFSLPVDFHSLSVISLYELRFRYLWPFVYNPADYKPTLQFVIELNINPIIFPSV